MDSYRFSDWKNNVDNLIDNQKKVVNCDDDGYSLCWQNNMSPNDTVEAITETFEEWKLYIDKEVYILTGYHCDNLPDYDYWNTWNRKHIKKEKVIEDIINNFKKTYKYGKLMDYKYE